MVTERILLSLLLLNNNNNRKNRENATGGQHSIYEFDLRSLNSKDENDESRRRDFEPEEFSLSLFLSFRPKETRETLLPVVVVQKSSFLNERRGLDETTKKNQQVSYQSAIHEERKRDSSSSIEPFKDEKKNRMNWSQTHNFNVRPPFSVFRDRRRPERRDGDRDQRGRVVVFVAVGSRAQIRHNRLGRRVVSSSSSRWCLDAHDVIRDA